MKYTLHFRIAALLLYLSIFSFHARSQVITGHPDLCLGASRTTLSTTATGGVWSSGNASVATIDPTLGVVTGISSGTATISYYIAPATVYTTTVTVRPFVMSPIGFSSGSASLCAGGIPAICTVSPVSGNNWTSSDPSITSVTTAGFVTPSAMSTGTSVISYRHLAGNCFVTRAVSVNPVPTVSISSSICNGTTQTASAVPSGGSWVSSNTSVGTINSASGVFTGFTGGSTNIRYTSAAGCQRTINVTVLPLPASINGALSFCVGNTSLLSSLTAGGTWSSSNGAVASINPSTGLAIGLSPGTTIISYTNAVGCMRTVVATVNAPLPTISGVTSICVAQTATLTNAVTGGTWGSSAPAIATVNPSGILTGVSIGTANITYRFASGCYTTTTVTVSSLGPIIGSSTLCVGSTQTLVNSTPGGTWSVSNANASITSGGDVTGVSPGAVTITYALGASCFRTFLLNVRAVPSAISGPSVLCPGAVTALTSATAGGTWTSSDPLVVSIGASTGGVTATGVGVAIITYNAGGCNAVKTITVNSAPSITGGSSVCAGGSLSLSASTTGGTWASSNTTVATVGTDGIVSGLFPGTSTITYNIGSGCLAAATVTVNATAGSITGPSVMCAGGSATLTASVGGGVWSSSNISVADITTGGLVTATGAGSATISYTVTGGCAATLPVVVTTSAGSITGGLTVCAGQNTTLASSSAGGSWTSSNTSLATVGSLSGVVHGVSAGTATISYVIGGACYTTAIVSVLAAPSALVGGSSLCVGNTLTLSSPGSSGSGTWSSNDTGIANVSLGGSVTGVATGVASITYSEGACFVTTSITVSATAGTITGSSHLCAGSTITLSAPVSGGTWVSSDVTLATVGSSGGVVTGLATGVVTISYVLGGCMSTATVTVDSSPSTITGPSTVCIGGTANLANSVGGGTWTSSNTGIASVGSSSGVVSGNASGTATISYTLSSGCSAGKVVTVTSAPGTISGATPICVVSTVALSVSTSGGAWFSGDTSIFSVSATGVVTGKSGGTATVSYIIGSSCIATRVMTVLASPAAISGGPTLCLGSSTALAAAGGSYWVSSNASVASVGSLSGVATAVSAGTARITVYNTTSGCYRTLTVTVSAMPAVIEGTMGVCAGATRTLTSATGGGSWYSSNTSVATVSSSTGVVTGITPGTTTISYMIGSGCLRTVVFSVHPAPGAIGGSLSVCLGSSTTLTNPVSGGFWYSSAPSVASINVTSGVVTSGSVGTTLITYQTGTGCNVTTVLTVNVVPSSLAGTASVCVGSSVTLYSSPAGGSWISGSPGIATVGSAGLVTGVATGTSVISYVMPTSGCMTTRVVTVGLGPTISGPAIVCTGANGSYSVSVTGGTWSVSDMAVGTIGSSSGVLAGLTPGNAIISYVSAGCLSATSVTVSPTPTPISGPSVICAGGVVSLVSSLPFGSLSWSTSNAAVATVSSAGAVTGISAGTTVITATEVTGCMATRVQTVLATPPAISGSMSVCAGSSTILTPAHPGGTWSVSALSVASISSVDTVTGAVSLLSSTVGTITVTYAVAGCVSLVVVTVNTAPAAITGTPIACLGATTTLSCTTPGGVWSSSNAGIAPVGSTSGIVMGVSVGTARITYAFGSCFSTVVVTVNGYPSPIAGSTLTCIGAVTTLSATPTGGVWTSSAPARATIVATSGTLTGVSPGTSTIRYTLSGCASTLVVTVISTVPSPLPVGEICVGGSASTSLAATGGTWSSSNPFVASVSSSGVISGMAPGTATITYMVTSACYSTTTVTVIPSPAPVYSGMSLCVGSSISLATPPAGATVLSSNTAIATVSSGVLTGVAAGTCTLSVFLPTGCVTTSTVTVNPLPSSITGALLVCEGTATTLSSASPGGTWSSSNLTVVTVGSSTGMITALGDGTSTITYTVGTGCYTTAVVTVESLPTPISGTFTLCVGATVTLSSSPGGGSWSSSITSVATVGSSGIVTGLGAGTSMITYTTSSGCFRTVVVTVYPSPAPITGSASICVGGTTTLSTTTLGGTWSSSNSSVAVVLAPGFVGGPSAGTATISYTISSGCFSTLVVSVYPTPSAIGGTLTVCVGSSTTLTNSNSGGTWSTSTPSIGTINATTGSLTGISAGTTNVTYSLGSGCIVTATVTVFATPSITGSGVICDGFSTVLTASPSGGTWSSSTPSVGTVGTSGTFVGIWPGIATVYHTLATGCSGSRIITVNPMPAPITGSTAVCVGQTATLSSASTGGTWSSSNTSVLSISAGVMTGVSAGTATVTYTLGSSCFRTATILVNALPTSISGTLAICTGSSSTLTGSPAGGTWSSSNPGVITITTGGGSITGLTTGIAIITYRLAAACYITSVATSNPLPAAITGSLALCNGSTTTLSSATAGGTWSAASGTGSVSVGASTGIVLGSSPGTATISYTISTGCRRTAMVTVYALPGTPTGTTTVCTGLTATLTATPAGGVWSSSNTSVASIDMTSGVFTGVSPGMATITYTLGTGCLTSRVVSVDGTPSAGSISGSSSVTTAGTTTLTSTVSGGAWSSSAPTVASVGSITGVVTGIVPGSATISYTVTNSCGSATATVSVTVSAPRPGVAPELPGAFSVFPNPTPGVVNIISPFAGTVVIYAADGKEVLKQQLNAGANDATIPYGLPSGIYMLRITGADGSVLTKRLDYTP